MSTRRLALVDQVMRRHRRWIMQQEAAAAAKAARDAEAARRVMAERAAAALRASAVADAIAAIDERHLTRRQLEALLSDVREFRRLQEAAVRYGDEHARAAVTAIEAARADLIVRSQRVGVAASVLQLDERVQGRVAGMLQMVPVREVSRLAGLGASASPLRTLQTMGEASSMRVLDAMVRGMARGESPRRVAEQVARHVTDASRADVLNVTRSEMLRASRASTTAWTEANADLMDGSTWYAELDDATCASCWAMHGTRLENDEILGTHPGCRCSAMPRPKSPADLGFVGIPDDRPEIETGEARFARLSVEQRRGILGPAKAAAYEDGRIALGDVVNVREDDAWGTTRSVGSLDAALRRAG